MHEKKPPAGLAAAWPSESSPTISQWPEGLLRSSRFLILITYNIFAVAIRHRVYRKTHISQRPEILSQGPEKRESQQPEKRESQRPEKRDLQRPEKRESQRPLGIYQCVI